MAEKDGGRASKMMNASCMSFTDIPFSDNVFLVSRIIWNWGWKGEPSCSLVFTKVHQRLNVAMAPIDPKRVSSWVYLSKTDGYVVMLLTCFQTSVTRLSIRSPMRASSSASHAAWISAAAGAAPSGVLWVIWRRRPLRHIRASKEEDQVAQFDPSSLGSKRAGGKEMETHVAAIVNLRCYLVPRSYQNQFQILEMCGAQPMNRFNSERMNILPLRVCGPLYDVLKNL
jgi:hypothetical protein